MIRNEAGLNATRESLVHLENSLLDLTRKQTKYHAATFALIAKPIRDAIHARRAEIDEYIGLTAGEQIQSPHDKEAKLTVSEYEVERGSGVLTG
jgi:hypothetical protein